jgi:chitin disaccharide deacetylase
LRLVIVNADDFGFSRGVNRGIIEAHERGIVTSASLMVRRRAAAEAAGYGREHPALGVGLHADLDFPLVGERLWTRVRRLVARDLDAQIERFRRLLGRDPTHIDSHHHRHRDPRLREVFESAAEELDVPLRHLDPRIHFNGEFYGHDGAGRPDHGSITPEALIGLLEALPEGIVELGCHPGYTEGLRDWYRDERPLEVASLCDPAVRQAVARLGIELSSFGGVPRRRATEEIGHSDKTVST